MKTEKDMLFVEERKTEITQLIERDHKVSVKFLSNLFNVSNGTIRNDLRELEKKGLLTRTHGGAIQKIKASFEPDTNEREIQNLEKKKIIAELALNLVEDRDTILMDAGTTTFELARMLPVKNNLCIVTNDLRIASLLEENDNMTVVMIGGQIRNRFHCVTGTLGAAMLSKLSVDKAFFGTNSFSLAKGATSPDLDQAEIRMKMRNCSSKTIILCDSSKLDKHSFIQFASVDQIDSIVVDRISQEDQTELENNGVEVIAPVM